MVLAHPSLGDPGDEVHYYPQHIFSEDVIGTALFSQIQPIVVRVPRADILTIFAHRQWRAGMLMADLIASDILPIKGCSVLELGAGTGLPSIAACKLGKAKTVVCTDYDSSSLAATLKDNVLGNLQHEDRVRTRIAGHTWGKAIDDVQDLTPGRSFDIILLADCIWDDLSHASLLNSVSALLTRKRESRVFMVSGLHTGREKIISFIRRSYRAGLHLVPFPQHAGGRWPALNEYESQIEATESIQYASDDALKDAPRYVMEMQLHFDDSEEITTQLKDKTRVWHAKTSRLTHQRRAFVIEERPEEKKEVNGIEKRNHWITFLALAWKDS